MKKKIFALTAFLTIGMVVLFLYISGITPQLSCKDFISNSQHANYIDRMMEHYISSNTRLQRTLANGKVVVFMFEGGSDHYPANNYSSSGSNIRNQAVCIVVKQINGTNQIVFYNENCSSIPSQPEDTGGGDYDRQTTILDGIYRLQTCNHNGQYGALNVVTGKGYYTPPFNKDGSIKKASGINIHTRSSANAGYKNNAWSWGCQLIGSGNDSSNPFNEFMKAVTGTDCNVWTENNGAQNTLITPWQEVGYYVLDRQLGLDGLANIYTAKALETLTAFSAAASATD